MKWISAEQKKNKTKKILRSIYTNYECVTYFELMMTMTATTRHINNTNAILYALLCSIQIGLIFFFVIIIYTHNFLLCKEILFVADETLLFISKNECEIILINYSFFLSAYFFVTTYFNENILLKCIFHSFYYELKSKIR